MKAQIKMAETMAILIIFFFLLMFGFSFYVGIQKRYVEQEQDKILQLKSLQITQKASYLPELQCSIQNIQYDNCFDVQKAKFFFNMTHGDGTQINYTLINFYYDILGFSSLYIEEVYPGNELIYIYNQSLDSNNASRVLNSQVPVSLYNGKTNTYSIGVLYIQFSVK